jgi:ATP/maltotriose-dependent transcriptional regulator MalT
MKGLLETARGRAVAALDAVTHAAGVFERLGYRLDLAESRCVLAECFTATGRLDEAEKALKDCLEYGESAGAVSLRGASLLVLAELRLKGGGERLLRPVLSAIEKWMPDAGTQLPELSWRLHHAKGRVLAALGDGAGATAAFRTAMGIVKSLWQQVPSEGQSAYISESSRQRLRKDMHDSVTMGGQS